MASSFLTSALGGGKWRALHPHRFTPEGKSPRYPLDRRLGGPQSGPCGEEKNLVLLEIEPEPSSPVARRYTD
jgi:hypothetical protein